jgi:hypothetical protein
MEVSKGNKCIAILNNKTVTFYKNGELVGRVGTSGKWEDVRRRYRRVNMVEKLCTHVCKQKNGTC